MIKSCKTLILKNLICLFLFSTVVLSSSERLSQFINPQSCEVLIPYLFAKNELNKRNTPYYHLLYANYLKSQGFEHSEEISLKISNIQQAVDYLRQNSNVHTKDIFDSLGISTIEQTGISLAFNQPIDLAIDADPCSFATLKKAGISENFLDQVAIEYIRERKNSFMAVFWPQSAAKIEPALDIISEFGEIVYSKKINITSKGFINLLSMCYELARNTLHNVEMKYAYDRMIELFSTLDMPDSNIYLVVWECDSLKTARLCKQKIRRHYKISYSSVHMSDNQTETLHYAQVLFNKNGVHFINHANPKPFQKFLTLLETLQKTIKNTPSLEDFYAIDTGAVLAAYGLRDCKDFDLIVPDHMKQSFPKGLGFDIGGHNNIRKKFGDSLDDLIYNPENYFYYKSLKFISIKNVHDYYLKKGEAKARDLKKIKRVLD